MHVVVCNLFLNVYNLLTRSRMKTIFLFISLCMAERLAIDSVMNPIRDNRLLDCLVNL